MSVTPENAPVRPAYIRDAASGLYYKLAVQGLPGSGSEGGVADHGLLTGLSDDDHPQYHNDARGDARYSVLAHGHAHSALSGLTGDDHLQYHTDARGDARYVNITGDTMTGLLTLNKTGPQLTIVNGTAQLPISIGATGGVALGDLTGANTTKRVSIPIAGQNGTYSDSGLLLQNTWTGASVALHAISAGQLYCTTAAGAAGGITAGAIGNPADGTKLQNAYQMWYLTDTPTPGNQKFGIGKVPTVALDVLGAGLFSGTVSAATPTAAGHLATKAYVDSATPVLPPESDANGNTSYGTGAQPVVSTGYGNIALGQRVQESVNSGAENVGIGHISQVAMTTGSANMAIGYASQMGLSSGGHNVGIGSYAQAGITTGLGNTGIGRMAQYSPVVTSVANHQTAIGYMAGAYAIGSGDSGTSIGRESKSHTAATALGALSEARGILSTAIGYGAIATLDNQIMLGTVTETVHAPGSLVTPVVKFDATSKVGVEASYDASALQIKPPLGGWISAMGAVIGAVGPAVNDGDALNKGYADARYVNVAGDTMTGPLTVGGDLFLPNSDGIQWPVGTSIWGGSDGHLQMTAAGQLSLTSNVGGSVSLDGSVFISALTGENIALTTYGAGKVTIPGILELGSDLEFPLDPSGPTTKIAWTDNTSIQGDNSWGSERLALSSLNVELIADEMVSFSAANWDVGTMLGTDGVTIFANRLDMDIKLDSGRQLQIRGEIALQSRVDMQFTRWAFGRDENNEPGGNVGADFYLDRYDDTGTKIGNVLTISRATGMVTLTSGFIAPDIGANTVSIYTAPTAANHAVTKAYVDAARVGRNRIINGDFSVNQRALATLADGMLYDRWHVSGVGGTRLTTAVNSTSGELPESAKSFIRIATSGQTLSTEYTYLQTKLESVRTLSGKTVTLSFWAKAASGTPKVAFDFSQNFGSGGSATVNTPGGVVTLSTVWTRYQAVVSLPAITGKTIGTANDLLQFRYYLSAGSTITTGQGIGIQNNTIDFWGMQLEEGSIATPYEYKTPTEQLLACQRYYWRRNYATNDLVLGVVYTANEAPIGSIDYPVVMRTVPTIGFIGNGTARFISPSGSNLADKTLGISVVKVDRCTVYSTTTAPAACAGWFDNFTIEVNAEF